MENEESGLNERETERNDGSLPPEVTVRDKKFKCPLTVEPILFGVFFADALSDPVTSNFILLRTCENHFHYNHSVCSDYAISPGNKTEMEAEIQPYSAIILTSMNCLAIVLPAFIALFVGPWSDYNGRKPLLVVPACGYFLKFLLLGVFTCIPSLGPEFGLLAVLPVALCGGLANFVSAAYSYISDITVEEKRFIRISVIEVVLGLGIASALFLLTEVFKPNLAHRYIIIYGTCAGAILITTVPTFFFLPESLENIQSGKKFFQLNLFKEMFDVCFRKISGVNKTIMFLLIACLTIAMSIGSGNANVLYFFTRLRFGWNIQDFSKWASITLSAYFLGSFFVVLTVFKWLKVSEAVIGFLAFLSQAAMSFYMAFIPPENSKLMFYVCLVNIFGGSIGPICRAILSKIVPKDDLGKVFALTSSSESVFPLIVGPLFTALYNSTIDTLPSAFLLLSGALYILCCALFVIVHFAQKLPISPGYGRMESHLSITSSSADSG